jgi:hypothetical protein
VPKFIQLVEQGDNSIHYVNLEEIVQIVHVPDSPIASVHLTDGKSFRVSGNETKRLMTAFGEEGHAAQTGKGTP